MSISVTSIRNTAFSFALVLFSVYVPSLYAEPEVVEPKQTDQGLFLVAIESQRTPIPINRMHAWEVFITHASGEPLEGANVKIDGGMPQHDHGLPTAPRMTERLDGGRYLIEGVKFHMNGQWEITLEIQYGEESDQVTFILEI